MAEREFKFRVRPPLGAPEDLGGKPPVYRQNIEDGMLIERDVAVTMRDGVKIYVDIFRPLDDAIAAPIISWGPYGKHGHTRMAVSFPGSGVDEMGLSMHTIFEAPDPMFWVPRGYAIINVDPRGTWFSEGRATYLSIQEAYDYYDLIEWAGTQPWSAGKCGLSGISYLTQSQWQVAALNPPHLGAINPWEGFSDLYREVAYHGGIPETHFWGSGYLPGRWGRSKTEVEDLMAETKSRPLMDDYWRSKIAPLEDIKVPAYVVASWTDQGLHTRGTLEAFKRISSEDKWLEVHGRKKWAYYYEPDSLGRQAAFFDRYLLGKESSVGEWPKVRLEIRDRYYVGTHTDESEWPVARTQYKELYLDAATASLTEDVPDSASTLTYSADEGAAKSSASFRFVMNECTDLVGYMKLRLWLSAETANDADLFVEVKKLDTNGEHVPLAFFGLFETGPVALGWLRASHRELDEAKSTPYQPVHTHERQIDLVPGEPTALEIEIWPSGTRFGAGEQLVLTVQGRDVWRFGDMQNQMLHNDSVNSGNYTIHTGGKFDSHLLVPVLPSRGE